MRRAKLTGLLSAFDQLGPQHRVARQRIALDQIGVFNIRCHLCNQHRRCWRQKVRENNIEQMARKRRVLHFQFKLNTRRQESCAFDQALDVGVEHLQPVHTQPRGNLWIGIGKFGPHLTQKGKFGFVMTKKPRIHAGQPTRSSSI